MHPVQNHGKTSVGGGVGRNCAIKMTARERFSPEDMEEIETSFAKVGMNMLIFFILVIGQYIFSQGSPVKEQGTAPIFG